MNENTRKLIMPVVVLCVICLVVTGALAVAFQITNPIIQDAAAKAAQAARAQVLPGGTDFTSVDTSALPATVTEAYTTGNGAGYVFSVKTKGYGGKITIMVGIKADGTVAGTAALDVSSETKDVDKLTGPDFTGQFVGKDSALEGVDTLSGATYSSTGYVNAVRDALTAYEVLSGKEGS